MAQVWKASLPSGSFFVEASSWYFAREICRILHQDVALEKYWREEIELAGTTEFKPGAVIYFLSERGEVEKKIIPSPPGNSKKSKRSRNRRKK